MAFNLRQRKFVVYYEGNATKAAIEAGYSPKTAKSQGQRLLTYVDIQEALEERYNKELDAKVMKLRERQVVLSEIARDNTVHKLEKWEPGCVVAETEEGDMIFVRVSASNKDRIKSVDVLNKMDGTYLKKAVEVLGHEDWVKALINDEKGDGEDV